MIIYTVLISLTSLLLEATSGFTNITEDDSPVCPVNLFLRHKRSVTEYTRWRPTEETTPEFIVKVLDDDISSEPVKAINIKSSLNNIPKIIIGGVIMPKPTSSNDINKIDEALREYTRFIHPTRSTETKRDGFEGSLLTPLRHKGVHEVKPLLAKHSERDESPPSGPNFIPRPQNSFGRRQYAPVKAVAFSKRNTLAAQSSTGSIIKNIFTNPTRTSVDDVLPLGTNACTDEVITSDVENNITDMFHKKYFGNILLTSSSSDENMIKENYKIIFKNISSHTKNLKQSADDLVNGVTLQKDSEDFYNMVFYGDNDDKKESEEFYDERNNRTNYESESDESEKPRKKYHHIKEKARPNTESIFPRIESVTEDTWLKNTAKTNTSKISQSKKPKICDLFKRRTLTFNALRTLPEIVSKLKKWAEESPIVKWKDITNGNLTTMENPIYMIIVDDPSRGQIVSAKQTVMIVAGMQGRDHHAVAAAMYVLYQLIERSEAHSDILSKYRFWVIPVFNPDGYDYSVTSPQGREWTKNLRQTWKKCAGKESCSKCQTLGLGCIINSCYGVNLDRNFEYQWIPTDELQSEHPCGRLYAGERQLSELETRALSNFFHHQHAPIYTFIVYKEGDVLGVMYPYSHTKKKRTFDHVYRQKAMRAAAAASSVSGRSYVSGQTSEFLPLYAGGIEDWVNGHLGTDHTYNVMIFRPTDSHNSKYLTDKVLHEAYAAMGTLLFQISEPATEENRVKLVSGSLPKNEESHLSILLACALLYVQYQ